MPKVKWAEKKRDHMAFLLNGTIRTDGKTLSDIASILDKSEATVCRKLRDPSAMPLKELLNLCRGLGIPIEDVRGAIRY